MNDVQIRQISKEVKNNGVSSLNNFFGTKHFNLASSILTHTLEKGDKRGSFPVFFKTTLIKLLKLDFNQVRKSLVLKKIAQDLNLEKISELIFENKAELHAIDSYYSEKSNEFIVPWHNDIGLKDDDTENFLNIADSTINQKKSKTSPRGVKFFVHLTDVSSQNGSLAVIPYSHHVVKAVTKLILEKKINLERYWKLEDLRSLVLKDSVKPLIIEKIGEDKLNIFLNNSKFAEEKGNDTLKFDFQMKKGGVVIFDELCVHRGSMPKEQSRLVLRYIYRRKFN